MKNRILIGLGIGLMIWLTSGAWMTTAADLEEEEAEEEVTEEDFQCGLLLAEEVPPLIEEYEEFLNDYYKATEPTSDQIEKSMSYYRYIEAAINNLYDVGLGLDFKRAAFTKQADEFAYCTTLRDQYLQYTRALLLEQALQSASSKRTFQVIDGLKAMNENMEEFSVNFHSTFPTMFNKMNNALPCYAKQCITK